LLCGKIKKSNLKYKRPAIFIDRDGVINKEINLLCKADDFELISGVASAIKKINDSGYLAVIVTNQPAIARNLIDFNGLRQIHNKMEWLLGKQGCYLDAIYFCPHHPDSGYPEERREFKVNCDCRKPKPGMILCAAEELNIDLEKSFIIGDRESDILAGKNAGITTVLVKINGEYWENQDSCANMKFNSLEEAVNTIL
ncbi:MAG: D-glycero-alpha-D-manno-heptose-1,7-bisphosphate 7-phosphatase, partial [Candidatus Humimicrobiaceae bacterium]